MNIEEVKKLLINDGFVKFTDSLKKYENYSYQKRIEYADGYECNLNNKLFVNVCISTIPIQGDIHTSVTVQLVAQNSKGHWFNVESYGLSLAEFVSGKDIIIDKLVNAWKFIY